MTKKIPGVNSGIRVCYYQLMAQTKNTDKVQFKPGNSFWKLRAVNGRDFEYKTQKELIDAIVKYFEKCDKSPWMKNEAIKGGDKAGKIIQIPTQRPYAIGSLCAHLGIVLNTWKSYKERPDFLNIITHTEQIIEAQQFEGATVGAFNANIIARKLGLADKQEITTETKRAPRIVLKNSSNEK